MQKLDNIFEEGAVFDLIKIDTQGSELDILEGGKDIVSRTSIIILEVSFIEHNIGSPTAEQTLDYMKDIGFTKKMSIGEHYDENKLVQEDIVFVREKVYDK